MFAALSSFLPNALQLNDRERDPPPAPAASVPGHNNDADNDDEPAPSTSRAAPVPQEDIVAEKNIARPRRPKQEKPLNEVCPISICARRPTSNRSTDIHHCTTTSSQEQPSSKSTNTTRPSKTTPPSPLAIQTIRRFHKRCAIRIHCIFAQ